MLINILPYISANIISVAILLLLYCNKAPFGVKTNDQRNFDRLIIATIVTLIADTGMWLIDKQAFVGARVINLIISSLCYAFTPIVGLLCVVYVDSKIYGTTRKAVRRLLPFYVITAACAVMVIVNLIPSTDLLFKVSVDNVYSRGSVYWLFTVIPFAFMLYSFVQARIGSRRAATLLSRREYNYMSWFVIPPLLGGTLQGITGLSFTWSCVAISLLILFIKFQNQQVATDTLTGINNRRQLENYLAWQFPLPQKQPMFALMVDIDGFKAINDTYGHGVGDNALIDTAQILSAAIGKNDFVARYGGDEFMIITRREDYSQIEVLLDNINSAARDFNSKGDSVYKLVFSIGCAKAEESDSSYEAFIVRADKRMYEVKNGHTAAKCDCNR